MLAKCIYMSIYIHITVYKIIKSSDIKYERTMNMLVVEVIGLDG